jgi:hypothetical protein
MKYPPLPVPADFWDLTKLEAGTIVYDLQVLLDSSKPNFRALIIRGPVAWCCYIGVPLSSPLAGLFYSDSPVSEFDCHGGLTFAGYGDDESRPKGWYYFGWDYGHYGDWIIPISSLYPSDTDRKWTFGEVRYDIEEGLLRMKEIQESMRKSMNKFMPKFTSYRKRLIRVNGAE